MNFQLKLLKMEEQRRLLAALSSVLRHTLHLKTTKLV